MHNINIELDANVLVHLLSNPASINFMLEPLLNDYRTLIRPLPSCSVIHIFREANRCADRLAKMGADLTTDFQISYEPPPVVDSVLTFDKAEIFCN